MDLLNYDDEKTCGNCQGVGRVKRDGQLIEFDVSVRKVSDLSITEFKTLMVDCFGMCKQRELDTSMEEYKRLTTKPIGEQRMYKIKVHGMDTLVLDGNKNGVARFYGSDGFQNARLFVSAKEKADEIFVRNGEPVSKEY